MIGVSVQKNIKREILSKMDNRFTNLKEILLQSFKGLFHSAEG